MKDVDRIATRRPCQAAVDLVKDFESLALAPYLCPAGVWTIGYGHVLRGANGETLKGSTDAERARALYPSQISREQAESLLMDDLLDAAHAVQQLASVPLSDAEFGALVSFVFNVGAAAFGRSTLLQALNHGHYDGAASELLRWVYAGRRVMPGLVKRRKAERRLFLSMRC